MEGIIGLSHDKRITVSNLEMEIRQMEARLEG